MKDVSVVPTPPVQHTLKLFSVPLFRPGIVHRDGDPAGAYAGVVNTAEDALAAFRAWLATSRPEGEGVAVLRLGTNYDVLGLSIEHEGRFVPGTLGRVLTRALRARAFFAVVFPYRRIEAGDPDGPGVRFDFLGVDLSDIQRARG